MQVSPGRLARCSKFLMDYKQFRTGKHKSSQFGVSDYLSRGMGRHLILFIPTTLMVLILQAKYIIKEKEVGISNCPSFSEFSPLM